jgi:hypothetical protein
MANSVFSASIGKVPVACIAGAYQVSMSAIRRAAGASCP